MGDDEFALIMRERYNPLRVNQLKLQNDYVIDRYAARKHERYGGYYYCNIRDILTDEKINLYSNFYLMQEIDKFRELELRRRCKIHFRVTRRITNPSTGNVVSSVSVNYCPK